MHVNLLRANTWCTPVIPSCSCTSFIQNLISIVSGLRSKSPESINLHNPNLSEGGVHCMSKQTILGFGSLSLCGEALCQDGNCELYSDDSMSKYNYNYNILSSISKQRGSRQWNAKNL